MIIKFLKSFNGSEDGITLKRFKAEGIYKVPSDLSFVLANIAIVNKYAYEIEEEKVEDKLVLDLIIEENEENEEIIEIEYEDEELEEEETETETEEEDKVEIPKFVKTKSKKKKPTKASKKK